MPLNKSRYYDKQGKAISLEKWVKLFEDYKYKVIKQSQLPNGTFISTIWLGLNHCFNDKDEIIIDKTRTTEVKND